MKAVEVVVDVEEVRGGDGGCGYWCGGDSKTIHI